MPAAMAFFPRAMIPVVALAWGSWLGMGRPDVRTAFAQGAHALTSVAAAAHEIVPTRLVPPLEREPPTVDASALPDPPLPWPRLNPEDSNERAWLIAEGPAHPRGDGRRLVTFTFDDGPSCDTAPTMLRILDQHKIHATFFLIGEYLTGDDRRSDEARQWARRLSEAGHLIGNHTLEHRLLTGLSHAAALGQIDDSAGAIERAVGRRPILFRPPFGQLDPWLEGALRERQLELVLWSIDVEDMKREDPDEITQLLQQQLTYRQGGIVLLHDMHWPSVKAFNRLLRWLESSRWSGAHPEIPGWSIVDLPEYFRAIAASPQPYASREELERTRRAALDKRPRPQ
jgi:peptidoglycan/xylan/chitin deacetylase (PgdA/CDA1 family)